VVGAAGGGRAGLRHGFGEWVDPRGGGFAGHWAHGARHGAGYETIVEEVLPFPLPSAPPSFEYDPGA
jgi:hypothetical protein